MRVDMFGFKQQHKLITSEGMDMIRRQIECDNHNISNVFELYDNGELDKRLFRRYVIESEASYKQQKYALEKGRFR